MSQCFFITWNFCFVYGDLLDIPSAPEVFPSYLFLRKGLGRSTGPDLGSGQDFSLALPSAQPPSVPCRGPWTRVQW